MARSFFKQLFLNANFEQLTIGVGVVFLMSGCATTGSERSPANIDAAHNTKVPGSDSMQSRAQAAWENQPFSASADYHFTLAQAYSTEGKVDRAIEEYRAALAYDPASSVIHARLAGEYLKKGTVTFAIEECKRSLELEPDSIDVHLMLGGIYSMSNQSDLALAEYDTVLKLQPGNDEAAVFKTQVLVEKERIAEATKFIRGFTDKIKDSAAAWYYAGKLEHSQNNWQLAVTDYRRALELRPGFTQATIALGMVLEMHGENAKALEVYEAQMEERQDLHIAGRLATLYLKLNKFDRALSTLNTMRVLDPEDLSTQMRIGLVYMQKEQWNEAKATFQAILDKIPDSDKVNFYIAAVYEEQADFQKAIEHLLRVTADSKLFEDANLHAASMYRKQQKKEKAMDVLQSAIKRSPENAGFYLVLASMYEDEQNLKGAANSLESGLKIFPDHEKMRYFYGALLDKLGMQDEAIKEMEALLRANPQHADALNFIAYTWTSQGVRLKDAEEMLKRALKLKPNSPFILDSLGWNQFLLGHPKDALIYLEKAVALKSDETAILEHLVEVYARNQMTERMQATKVRIQKLNAAEKAAAARNPASSD